MSNVVRGAGVSEATRARVLRAIERLNYKPNAIARQFVKQRTTMLGVLVGDLSNPYYAQMAQVAERAAFRCGYTTMFCNIEGEENIAVAGVEALLEHRVAGIVFLAFISRTSQLEEALKRVAVPIVFLGLSEQWDDSVGPQDTQGGRLATEHLLALGHERIAYVRTPLSIVGVDDITLAGLHRISLTTVAQSLDFQAECAIALLMERIENPHIEPRHESVPVELKIRDPTGPPRR